MAAAMHQYKRRKLIWLLSALIALHLCQLLADPLLSHLLVRLLLHNWLDLPVSLLSAIGANNLGTLNRNAIPVLLA